LWLLLLILHKVLLHGSPSPSLSISLQILHDVVLKNNYLSYVVSISWTWRPT
jgi:hypothetical protein